MQGGLKTCPPCFAAYTPLLFPDNSTSLLYLLFCSIINERPETKFDLLQHRLHFSVTAYVKENGFLGIVSYNEYEDDLFIATKSTIDSQFTGWLRDMLYEKISSEHLAEMKDFIRENNVSFVFECVDMKHDPHIIEYPESGLYLLDIVRNQMQRSCMMWRIGTAFPEISVRSGLCFIRTK